MKMLRISDRWRSDLVENFSKFGPLRGIYAKLDGSQVEGIVVDHFDIDVECGGLTFQGTECIEILKADATAENLDNYSNLMESAGTIVIPLCLLTEVETFDI